MVITKRGLTKVTNRVKAQKHIAQNDALGYVLLGFQPVSYSMKYGSPDCNK